MIDWKKALHTYFIAGTQDIPQNETLEKVLIEAIEGGISCFQYREKRLFALKEYEQKIEIAYSLKQICHDGGIPFVINDSVELAKIVKPDAIHIGQGDYPLDKTLEIFLPLNIAVGLSVHDATELKKAASNPDLSYVGVGPVFPTVSKADAQQAIGIENLQNLAILFPHLAKVAIGGINLSNVDLVRQTNIDGVAIISAIASSQNRIEDTPALIKS